MASIVMSGPSFAQTEASAVSAKVRHATALQTSPGGVWLSIEDNMRNVMDAVKRADWSAISGYAGLMKADLSALQAAGIEGEVKPHEQEQLLKSFSQLETAIDELVAVSAGTDVAAIQAAVTKVSGAATLTRIDVPMGLLEKISGATVRAEIINTPALQKDIETTVTLRLKSAISGKPLVSSDLKEIRTKPVHALIADPQLEDYKHVHPEEIDVPGEYTLSITPKTACTYRLWADVTPVKGQQEYAMVDIPGQEGCGSLTIDKSEKLEVKTADYAATLSLPEEGLKMAGDSVLKLSLVNSEGSVVENLEPLMGAYAHMVGFYDDFRTITHLYPIGAEPVTEADRGRGDLSFHFNPEKAGFVKIFLQVRTGGQEHIFPFGVTVQE
ncbi:MAG: hypothetical protein HYS17_05345 [Micavibrio aeruginosavorus]|uniref:Uncharacterized protein n=1 Tax=Micavibrio aeruginosavorus TaxID=349221 RepID=A0A7T5UIZ3_9BACT|nr:MAG: hypothetical protein HYS17_05345 [Micavibrio aeruginosavorus]